MCQFQFSDLTDHRSKLRTITLATVTIITETAVTAATTTTIMQAAKTKIWVTPTATTAVAAVIQRISAKVHSSNCRPVN